LILPSVRQEAEEALAASNISSQTIGALKRLESRVDNLAKRLTHLRTTSEAILSASTQMRFLFDSWEQDASGVKEHTALLLSHLTKGGDMEE
jgi:hypothetical protein